MNSAKSWLIVVLCAAAVGVAWLEWRHKNELTALRASAMPRDERAEFQKRVWELEKTNRELRDRASGGDPAATATTATSRGSARKASPDARRDAEQQLDAVRGLFSKPEVQAMLSLQQKAAIDTRYAPLFKALNLTPNQAEQLKSLLAERTTTMLDVLAVARDQGVDPRDNPAGFRQLIANAQNEINQSIRGVIGDPGFTQLSTFEQTLPQRNLVNDLQQRLSYTSSPLSNSQAEQLVQILAENPAPRAATVTVATTATPVGGAASARIVDANGVLAGIMSGSLTPGAADVPRGIGPLVSAAAVTQSQTVLSPPQVAALQQVQQQQQAQQQLRQLVTETLGNSPTPQPATPARKPGGKP
ncbi:MAG: hypothetical protein ABIQ12_14060 [Opitutaceae bacterium]